MTRNLLATTALIALVATGAYAQNATTPAPAQTPAVQEPAAAPVARAEGSIVTNIIGESVYNGTGDDAEDIGKVSDVVFDKDGMAKSVVIGVGGFLGVGAKNVAFDYDKLQWAEKNGDRWLVARTTKDELTAQPEFDSKPYGPAPAPAASTDATAPTAPATTDTAQKPVDMNAATAEPVKRADGNLATNIIGETVYNGAGDDAQNIGSVNDIVLTREGKAQSLVIGVGGFLGLGAKNVAYDFDKAQWAEKKVTVGWWHRPPRKNCRRSRTSTARPMIRCRQRRRPMSLQQPHRLLHPWTPRVPPARRLRLRLPLMPRLPTRRRRQRSTSRP